MLKSTQLFAALTLTLATASAQLQGNDPNPNHPLTLPPNTIKQTAAPTQNQIITAKQALAAGRLVDAKRLFAAALQQRPTSIEAHLGLADTELALDEYEPAEADYRQIVAQQPQLWQAHKNLVVVEAALDRWEDFDNERTVLRLARERNAPGISTRESDVIDSFLIHSQRWIVREYYEPVGRTQTRYNFEHFTPDSKAASYISLDSAPIAAAAQAITIGDQPTKSAAPSYTLTWINGKAHGTIKTYGANEPTYEQVRAEVQHWLRQQK